MTATTIKTFGAIYLKDHKNTWPCRQRIMWRGYQLFCEGKDSVLWYVDNPEKPLGMPYQPVGVFFLLSYEDLNSLNRPLPNAEFVCSFTQKENIQA